MTLRAHRGRCVHCGHDHDDPVRAVIAKTMAAPSPFLPMIEAAASRALPAVVEGLLASLDREPTEAELRAAAHVLTVRADRLAFSAK